MKLRRLVTLFFAGLMVSASGFGVPPAKKERADFKALLQKTLEAWSTLDPANAAPFYAKDADDVFYDDAPLKYTGWAKYNEGTKKLLAGFSSLKFTLGDDVRVHQHGNLVWATATWHADAVSKDGAQEALDGRWTVVWERRGGKWLIVHEHFSVPLPAPPEKAGQSLYKRLGGYDAIAAVTDAFNVRGPLPTYEPQPSYSDQARRAKLKGTVVLEIVVDAQGSVSDVRVQKSLGKGLDEKAVEAVSKWKFHPATREGVPVPVIIDVEVAFRLI